MYFPFQIWQFLLLKSHIEEMLTSLGVAITWDHERYEWLAPRQHHSHSQVTGHPRLITQPSTLLIVASICLTPYNISTSSTVRYTVCSLWELWPGQCPMPRTNHAGSSLNHPAFHPPNQLFLTFQAQLLFYFQCNCS